MLTIALIATVLAFVQNLVMFGFGAKEMAIFSFPLPFVGICLAEIVLIWAGYVCVGRFLRHRHRLVLGAWVIAVLGAAEVALPASTFTTWVRHAIRMRVLNGIELAGTSIEPLAAERRGSRFALTYTLTFPRTGHYLTFPAQLGRRENLFGDYFTKVHPEYHDEEYVFDAGKPYSFTVIFDTRGQPVDFGKEQANIDICDSKGYFMACRVIAIGLEAVPAAIAASPAPVLREPAVPADNPRDIAEKNIRLDELQLKSRMNRTGEPVSFSFVISNVGQTVIAIPDGNLGNVIGVSYGWEAVSDGARATRIMPGIMRLGNAVAAGGAQFTFVRNSLPPGDTMPIEDKIVPFESFAPGEYKLHVYLFSRYATEVNRPVQELVQNFSVDR